MTAAADVGYGFRSEYKLRKTDEFSSVFAFRRALRNRYFVVNHCPNSGSTARLGVVVAKKLVKASPHRNLIKRVVRESFRMARAGLPCKDLVVRVVERMDKPDRAVLRAEIDDLLARLVK